MNALVGLLEEAATMTPRLIELAKDRRLAFPEGSGRVETLASWCHRVISYASPLDTQHLSTQTEGALLLGGWALPLGVRPEPHADLLANRKVPIVASPLTAYWIAEGSAAGSASEPTISEHELSPKTVSAHGQITRRAQSSPADVEGIWRLEIQRAMRGEIEKILVTGASGSNQPVGLKNASIGAQDASGGAVAALIAAIEDIHDANAKPTGILAAKTVKSSLMATSWNGGVAWRYDLASPTGESCMGLPAAVSADLSAGEIIIGDWRTLRLVVGSQIEFRAHRSATSGVNGNTIVSAFLDADLIIPHPDAFELVSNVP